MGGSDGGAGAVVGATVGLADGLGLGNGVAAGRGKLASTGFTTAPLKLAATKAGISAGGIPLARAKAICRSAG